MKFFVQGAVLIWVMTTFCGTELHAEPLPEVLNEVTANVGKASKWG